MSSPERKKNSPTRSLGGTAALALILSAGLVSACTVRPLYSSAPLAGVDVPASALLSSIQVQPVQTRVGQEVRNRLIFLLGGGAGQPAAPVYSVVLGVTSVKLDAAVIQRGREDEPTAGIMQVQSSYAVTDNRTAAVVASGFRQIATGYDIPRQAFAQVRAERDAENRAGRELAELLKLAIAQDILRVAQTPPAVPAPVPAPAS